MIHIFDGNNWYRKQVENDHTGLAPRKVLTETLVMKEPAIWVWDAKDGSRKRKAIYPDYKSRRGPVRKDIYVGFETVQEVLKHTQAIQICVPGFEADDVIANLARDLASKGDQVAIYSNDYDFVTLAGEHPNHIFAGATLKDFIPNHLVPYFKVTVGDGSDCISGIGGFGEKTWIGVDKAQLVKFIDAIVKEDRLIDIDLPKRCLTWLEANWREVQTFWKVVEFFDVPLDLISQHMSIGTPNYGAADAYLKEWHL